jgi:hypothetical protein
MNTYKLAIITYTKKIQLNYIQVALDFYLETSKTKISLLSIDAIWGIQLVIFGTIVTNFLGFNWWKLINTKHG